MFASVAYSQGQANKEKWVLSIAQDLRLAFTDDDHGNTAPTLDVIGKLELHTKQYKEGYIFFYPQIEYANLAGGDYIRPALGFGWTFNKLSEWIDLSPSFNCGMINRWGDNKISAEFQLESSIKLTDRLRLMLLSSYTERRDLVTDNNSSIWRMNGFIGIKYKL